MRMYKSLAVLCAITIVTLLAGCGETSKVTDTEATSQNITTTAQTTTKVEATIEEIVTTTKELTTSTTNPTTTTKASITPKASQVKDISVTYLDEANVYMILWELQDQNNNDIAADADITAKIVNNDDHEVYNNNFHKNSDSYSNWYGKLCGQALIQIKDITPDSTDKGDLEVSVNGDDFNCTIIFSIKHLPKRISQIILPSTPCLVNDYTWDGDIGTTLQISEITYSADKDTITLKFKCSLIYNSEGDNVATNARFAYRLLDKDGVIVDSENLFTNAIKLGETTYVEEKFYDFTLDFTQDYTLELWDVE